MKRLSEPPNTGKTMEDHLDSAWINDAEALVRAWRAVE